MKFFEPRHASFFWVVLELVRTIGDFQVVSLGHSQGGWNCDLSLGSNIKTQGFVLTSPELKR